MKKVQLKSIIKYSACALIFLIFFRIITMANPTKTAPDNADAIIGKWRSEAQDSEMEIYKSGNTYSAKMLAGWGKGVLTESDGTTLKKDARNSDATLQHRPLLNLEIISHLRYHNGEYTGGKVYLAVMGKTINCKMKFEGDKLVMRMYVGWTLFGKSKKWTKFH